MFINHIIFLDQVYIVLNILLLFIFLVSIMKFIYLKIILSSLVIKSIIYHYHDLDYFIDHHFYFQNTNLNFTMNLMNLIINCYFFNHYNYF